MKRLSWMLAALVLILGGVKQTKAEYTISFSQVGDNVEASGSGSLDVTDLLYLTNTTISPEVNSGSAQAELGSGSSVSEYYLASGPTNFGSSGVIDASSGSGDNVGIYGAGRTVLVPVDYISGDSLSSSATWDNTTFSGLGLTAGTYTWTWGSGSDADSFEVYIPSSSPGVFGPDNPGPAIATPEPASLALFGIGAICTLGYWRRRR